MRFCRVPQAILVVLKFSLGLLCSCGIRGGVILDTALVFNVNILLSGERALSCVRQYIMNTTDAVFSVSFHCQDFNVFVVMGAFVLLFCF